MAKPGTSCLYIDPGNGKAGWDDDLGRAVASGFPFAVVVDDLILAIDDDAGSELFEAMVAAVEVEGLVPVVLASGGTTLTGQVKRHLFARCPTVAVRDRLGAFWNARLAHEHGDVRADAHPWRVQDWRIRPPLSPHRTGHQPHLLGGLSIKKAIEALAPAHPTGRRLSQRALTILAKGPLAAGFVNAEGRPDRSRADAAVATSAINHDWRAIDLYAAYQLPEYAAGAGKVRERGWDYFLTTWRNAQEWIAAHPGVHDGLEATEKLAALREHATSMPFPGPTGATDRAVYLALIEAGLAGRTLAPRASQRRLAKDTGRTVVTVRAALKRLIARKLIVKEPSPSARQADGYRLLNAPVPARAGSGTTSVGISTPTGRSDFYCVSPMVLTQIRPCHDVFHRSGLGPVGFEILTQLGSLGAATATELAALTGRHAKTIRHRLRQMRDLGLIRDVGDHLHAIDPNLDLDQAARRLGVAGRNQARAAGYQYEQAAWAASFTATGPPAPRPASREDSRDHAA